MFCKNCGSELRENVVFCEKCGTRVEQEAPPVQPIQQAAPAVQPMQQTVQIPTPPVQQQTTPPMPGFLGKMLPFFPISARVQPAKTGSLLKAAWMYLLTGLALFIAVIIIGILPIIRKLGTILTCCVELYVGIGLLLAVVVFAVDFSRAAGQARQS